MNRLQRHLGDSPEGGRYQTALDPSLFGMGKNQKAIKIADNGELADIC